MSQEINHGRHSGEAKVLSQVIACRICGGQSGNGNVFPVTTTYELHHTLIHSPATGVKKFFVVFKQHISLSYGNSLKTLLQVVCCAA